jgi:hypothetical protein
MISVSDRAVSDQKVAMNIGNPRSGARQIACTLFALALDVAQRLRKHNVRLRWLLPIWDATI